MSCAAIGSICCCCCCCCAKIKCALNESIVEMPPPVVAACWWNDDDDDDDDYNAYNTKEVTRTTTTSAPMKPPTPQQHETFKKGSGKGKSKNKPAPSFSPSVSFMPSISTQPSTLPSASPTDVPSVIPTVSPSDLPSFSPSHAPTRAPSYSPTDLPSVRPSVTPTSAPTVSTQPSASPTDVPSNVPSTVPSSLPSDSPSDVPSVTPSDVPSVTPSVTPSISMEPSIAPSTVPSLVPSTVPSVAPSMVRVVRDGSVRYCVDDVNADDDVSSGSNVLEDNVSVLVQFEYEMEYSSSNAASGNSVNDLVSNVEDDMLEDVTDLVLDCNNNAAAAASNRLLRHHRHHRVLQDTTTTKADILAINSDPADQVLDINAKSCQLSSSSTSTSSCSVVQSMLTIYVAPNTNPTTARRYTLAVLETHLNSNPYAAVSDVSNENSSIQILSTKYRGAPPIDALGSNGNSNSNTNTDNFGTSAAQDVHSILGGNNGEDGIVIFSVVLVVLVVGLVLGALYKQYGVSDVGFVSTAEDSKHSTRGITSKLQKSYADLDDDSLSDQNQQHGNRSRRNYFGGSFGGSGAGRFKNYHVEIDQERSQTHDSSAEFYMGDDADSNGWEQCDTPSPRSQAQAQAQPRVGYQYHGDTTPTTNNSQNDDSSSDSFSSLPHRQQRRSITAWDNVHEEDLFLSQEPGFEVQVERPEVLGLSPDHYSNRNLQRRNSYGGGEASSAASSNTMPRTRSTPTRSRGGSRPSYHPDTVDL
uniref:Uncharacterized protein n=1 Tax=Leptocylindrus danicus TaxID=163516 RepID=A0A7S2JZF2_9STRA|mmetsp:Transcript_1424/g.2076  ORF Transcript_1424/g.2076 Transcript_1424/m.2076 type:complete len:752 (+) Transcript_1424:1604-3859(+)